MIPPEVVGHWCLGISVNYERGVCGVGVLKMLEDGLTSAKGNQDGKRNMNAAGMKQVIGQAKYQLLRN